jgi:hypothetical protein
MTNYTNAPDHIEQFFSHDHLPPELRAVSIPFCELAAFVVHSLPRNPERTVALRKLLEAKDAAVRAAVAKPIQAPAEWDGGRVPTLIDP